MEEESSKKTTENSINKKIIKTKRNNMDNERYIKELNEMRLRAEKAENELKNADIEKKNKKIESLQAELEKEKKIKEIEINEKLQLKKNNNDLIYSININQELDKYINSFNLIPSAKPFIFEEIKKYTSLNDENKIEYKDFGNGPGNMEKVLIKIKTDQPFFFNKDNNFPSSDLQIKNNISNEDSDDPIITKPFVAIRG